MMRKLIRQAELYPINSQCRTEVTLITVRGYDLLADIDSKLSLHAISSRFRVLFFIFTVSQLNLHFLL